MLSQGHLLRVGTNQRDCEILFNLKGTLTKGISVSEGCALSQTEWFNFTNEVSRTLCVSPTTAEKKAIFSHGDWNTPYILYTIELAILATNGKIFSSFIWEFGILFTSCYLCLGVSSSNHKNDVYITCKS